MILKYKLFLESVGKNKIKDLSKYNKEMSVGIDDKLYFLNRVNPDCIVDFGCANGLVLKEIARRNPDIKLIGYDLSQEMLGEAENNCPEAVFTSDWTKVIEIIKEYKTPLLLLSSVIHEVYSYTHPKTVKFFWDTQVFGSGFKLIAIRDMMPSGEEIKKINKSDIELDAQKIREKSSKQLEEFEKEWAPLETDYRFILAYLLKYKYLENWARENRENYMPFLIETFLKKIPSNCKIIYQDRFKIEPLNNEIKKVFGVEFRVNTHAKFILSIN